MACCWFKLMYQTVQGHHPVAFTWDISLAEFYGLWFMAYHNLLLKIKIPHALLKKLRPIEWGEKWVIYPSCSNLRNSNEGFTHGQS